MAVTCDVGRSADDIRRAGMDRTIDTFGRLDFAFNNAGLEHEKPVPTV